ncbi:MULTISPECIES: helix-turn-helix domain-containing protein [unclassified Pseudoclavibacter]|uniref:helix-turn-helix domain-containing protein n=1 Tax=unclassified Pseudoclavibacter TaxID=2615177 RepID=UPI00135AA880|nr:MULTISPECIES: helix-turn-helix domain-containing protein [unclassified Pseudoclavibacter]MBF4457641.1 AraC family transcriptional regulator [Pseudoclavibacter sp. VKM Ac-2867]
MIVFTFDQEEISPLRANRVPNVMDVSSSPLFTATYHFLNRLLSQSPDADHTTANSIRELLRSFARALVVESTRENIENPDDLFERVKELVNSRFSNLDFGPPEMARELGVSTRSLQRAAEKHGASVAKMLRTARAARARRLILTRPHLNLDVVSKMSGFNSVGSLRRALLSTHGVSVKDVRGSAGAEAGEPPSNPPSDPPADHIL